MGALTENRKRFSDNFSLSPAFASPHLPSPEHSADFPSSKRLRITSMPAIPDGPSSSQVSTSSTSKFRRLPPPQPLPRAVHAPQRSLKFARSAVPGEKPQVGGSLTGGGMGLLQSFMGGLRRLWSGKGDAGTRGMSRDDYKKLVEARESHSVGSDHATGDVCLPEQKALDSPIRPLSPAVASDTTGFAGWFEKGKEAVAGTTVNEIVDVEDTRVSDAVDVEDTWVGRSPLYKELHESARKRDSKLISLDFEVKLAEQKISAFQIASRPHKVKEGLARDAFLPLTDEEEDLVEHALYGPSSWANRIVLEYKTSSTRMSQQSLLSKILPGQRELLVTHESSNIEITREILQCLGPGAWLNDEVINLYLELLKEREKREPKKFLKCHFFNTFFYKKLISGRYGYDFKAVRRWTTQKKIGYGLIECDKIFVPIHKEVHWCLAIINVKDEKLQYLDSLGGRDVQVLRVLGRYFVDEVKDKSNKVIDLSSWKQEFVDDLPEQQNGYDCGVFMIKYADFYSRGLGLCFNQGFDHMRPAS
ncbi:hypothetical protein ACLOJK_026205 [Asimina triloba]